jgi:hypothetical protein
MFMVGSFALKSICKLRYNCCPIVRCGSCPQGNELPLCWLFGRFEVWGGGAVKFPDFPYLCVCTFHCLLRTAQDNTPVPLTQWTVGQDSCLCFWF